MNRQNDSMDMVSEIGSINSNKIVELYNFYFPCQTKVDKSLLESVFVFLCVTSSLKARNNRCITGYKKCEKNHS